MSTPAETADLSGLRISRGKKDRDGGNPRLKAIGGLVLLLVLGAGYMLLRSTLAPNNRVPLFALENRNHNRRPGFSEAREQLFHDFG